MSFNVHFINFEDDDFVSKNARVKMKKYIKENISICDYTNFYNIKDEILNRFVKSSDTYNHNLSCNVEDNNFKVTLNKYSINKDITIEMISLYSKTKKILGNTVPTPIEIRENKEKYINEIFQNLLNLTIKCTSLNDIFELLDTDYFNYIQLVCGFNYKDYLDQFLKKVSELTDQSSEIPIIIRNYKSTFIDSKNISKEIVNSLYDSDDSEDFNIHSDDI